VAYWFLKLTDLVQHWTYTSAPEALGFSSEPVWWPVLPLAVAGLCVGMIIRYLPGHGGESPAEGFKAAGVVTPVALPGIFLAAVASIGLGAVLGPEAPLIALGGGLAYLAVWLARRDVPRETAAVIAATGSFARSARCWARRWQAHPCCWRPPASAEPWPPPYCCPGCSPRAWVR
jgi:H+/Cl- antiporter ClcA